MGRLSFGSGKVRVVMDDVFERLVRNVAARVAPGAVEVVEESTERLYQGARSEWPVKSGVSRDGLDRDVTVSTDLAKITGRVFDLVVYARYVRPRKLGGKSAFVELLRKPLKAEVKRIVAELVKRTPANLVGGR